MMFKKIYLIIVAIISSVAFVVSYAFYDSYIGQYTGLNFGGTVLALLFVFTAYKMLKKDKNEWNRTFHCLECHEDITYPKINFQWPNGVIPSCHFHGSECSLVDKSEEYEEDHSGLWVFWGTFIAWSLWVAIKPFLLMAI